MNSQIGHPISCPHRWVMGHLFWVTCIWRKDTARYWEWECTLIEAPENQCLHWNRAKIALDPFGPTHITLSRACEGRGSMWYYNTDIYWGFHSGEILSQENFNLWWADLLWSKSPWFWINSLWSCDAMWRHNFGSTLAQVMACCLMAPSHYLNQCYSINLFPDSTKALLTHPMLTSHPWGSVAFTWM